MHFPAPIQKGVLVKRYKRFFADIDIGDKVITAHCANTGSMMGVKETGSPVWFSAASNPNRKLKYDWQVIEINNARICINTGLANRIVGEALQKGQLREFEGYSSIRPEVKYGQNSRIDFFLSRENRPDCYIEIKNVTLSRRSGLAEFPDARTERGTKHLMELAQMARAGHRAVMLYLINRTDCTNFEIARDIDPNYADTLDTARQAGVETMAFQTEITENGIILGNPVKIVA